MNMNVNPVGFGAKLPDPNASHGTKESGYFAPRDINNKELPVDNYVREMLANYGSEIEKLADFVGRDVVLAQRGNLLLANSGAKTSVIDMSKMKNGQELVDGIKNNLKINA